MLAWRATVALMVLVACSSEANQPAPAPRPTSPTIREAPHANCVDASGYPYGAKKCL